MASLRTAERAFRESQKLRLLSGGKKTSWIDSIPIWVFFAIPIGFAALAIGITLAFFCNIDWTLIIGTLIGSRQLILEQRATEAVPHTSP